jgi:hypothetical protein
MCAINLQSDRGQYGCHKAPKLLDLADDCSLPTCHNRFTMRGKIYGMGQSHINPTISLSLSTCRDRHQWLSVARIMRGYCYYAALLVLSPPLHFPFAPQLYSISLDISPGRATTTPRTVVPPIFGKVSGLKMVWVTARYVFILDSSYLPLSTDVN